MTDEAEYDKSELATPFKLSKAREKGSVARGSDLGGFDHRLRSFCRCRGYRDGGGGR